MEAGDPVASGFLGAVYMATGRADAAVRLYDRPPLRGTSYHAVALASAGRRNEAMEILRRAEPKAGPFDYGGFARAYAILGDKDRAFQWLTKAFDEHGAYIDWVNVSPMFDVLKGDPRFDALIARMHLPT